MQLEIETRPGPRLRLILVNDSFAPVTVSRNGLVGPSITGLPPAVEATFGGSEEPLTLQPFTFYGRDRDYTGLPPGEHTATATYTDPNTGERLTAEQRFTVPNGG